MIRTQQWTPDTHDAVLTCQWDDEHPEAPHICIVAVVAGVEQQDPQAVYETILAENQLKNLSQARVIEMLPDSMKKAVLDSDGDPTGETLIKDKHAPIVDYGPVDGRVDFTIPGASEGVLAPIQVALDAEFNGAVTVKAG